MKTYKAIWLPRDAQPEPYQMNGDTVVVTYDRAVALVVRARNKSAAWDEAAFVLSTYGWDARTDGTLDVY